MNSINEDVCIHNDQQLTTTTSNIQSAYTFNTQYTHTLNI